MENNNQMLEVFNKTLADSGIQIYLWRDYTTEKWKAKIDTSVHDKQVMAYAFEELKSLLRCRNYRGCAAGKGCNGVCSIDSDICKNCENFGIPYSLLAELQIRSRKNE